MTLGSIVIIAYFPLLCGQLAAWPYSQAASFGEYFPAPLFSFELTILTAIRKTRHVRMVDAGWRASFAPSAALRIIRVFSDFYVHITHVLPPGRVRKGSNQV